MYDTSKCGELERETFIECLQDAGKENTGTQEREKWETGRRERAGQWSFVGLAVIFYFLHPTPNPLLLGWMADDADEIFNQASSVG